MSPAPVSWKWRAVFRISRLITRISFPLHQLRWKILLFQLAALLLPLACLFIADRQHWGVILAIALLSILTAVMLSGVLAAYLTRIIHDLTQRARQIAESDPSLSLETWTQSEFGELAHALELMRRKLEGRAYVEEMALGLSHELKTPLAAIRGAAEVLEDGAVENVEARQRFLGNIQSEVGRLDRLVSDLLMLSRIETLPAPEETSPTDLSALAASLCDSYRARAQVEGLEFHCQSTGASITPIPEAACRTLLTCLLDNALQFTPSGGTVSLEINGSRVTVTDTGTGIDAALQPKIFDRFFTTENPRTGQRGSGLGLAIVKAIAQRHHLVIEVKSALGKGSRFEILFPLN
ncbi:MAG: ATP-binding protein [Chthoniobacteraceae bacterium]